MTQVEEIANKELNNVNKDNIENDRKKLWKQYKENGDGEAKDELLLGYTNLVKWLVRRMMPRFSAYEDADDLYSSGIIGLIDAMERYDPDQGVKFETFAVPRIRGEILDYLRAQDWAPPSLRRKINAINSAYDKMESSTGQPPTEEDVAQAVDIPISDLRKISERAHTFNVVSFENMLTEKNPDEMGVSEEASPEDKLIKEETKNTLINIIESLPEKERQVITLYYYEGMLLREIADMMHVTESRISQIHSKVIKKIREQMTAHEDY